MLLLVQRMKVLVIYCQTKRYWKSVTGKAMLAFVVGNDLMFVWLTAEF